MSIAQTNSPRNAGELEAEAEERQAKAAEYDALAAAERAAAHRLRAEAARAAVPFERTENVHVTRADYARRSSVSEATVTRWLADGMPSIPVGTTVRIDPVAADEWRRARGRKPTTAKPTNSPDVDVDGDLARAGLRVIGGRR